MRDGGDDRSGLAESLRGRGSATRLLRNSVLTPLRGVKVDRQAFGPGGNGGGTSMARRLMLAFILCGALLAAGRTVVTQSSSSQAAAAKPAPAPAQNTTPRAPGQAAPAAADPYANNAVAGTTKFPLAAPVGADSKALTTAPAGAVNQGAFDVGAWKYGTAFNPPADAKVWNPVKAKMLQGGKVTGGTLFSATDPAIYCAMANAGYDFIWTEMQHSSRDWEEAARMWRACPYARAVPGVRVAAAEERE